MKRRRNPKDHLPTWHESQYKKDQWRVWIGIKEPAEHKIHIRKVEDKWEIDMSFDSATACWEATYATSLNEAMRLAEVFLKMKTQIIRGYA